MAHITITGIDPVTGKLILSDHGHTKASGGNTIKWKIKKGSGVNCIVAITEKSGSTNIFSVPPHADGCDWSARIKDRATPNDEYIYAIKWADKNGIHDHDPVISIKPSGLHFKKLLLLFFGFLGLFFAKSFLFKEKK